MIESEPVKWSSSDSEIISIDENGWARSYWAACPGEAIITADAGEHSAQVDAVVEAQINSQCKESTTFPTQGVVAGVPSFEAEYELTASAPSYYANDAATGDFDGDNYEDIMIFSYNVPWDGTGDQLGEVLFWKKTAPVSLLMPRKQNLIRIIKSRPHA